MNEMTNTLSLNHCAKLRSPSRLRVDAAIDLQAQEKRGCGSAPGASFAAIHDPLGADYADLPAEGASALGIVVGATLPAPPTVLPLKPGLRGDIDRLA